MKKDRIVKSLMVLMGWVCCSLILGSGVMAQGTVNGTDAVGVAYRGHIQDYGDQPADEAWLDGDAQLGTTGESKRIEGFWIKLTGTENLPAGAGIRYNVHVQNVGWLASTDLTKTETWVANGNFAGSQSKSQRVEAIQIVLTGADGKVLPGYSVQYQVHGQDYGWSQGWQADGAIAGSIGESRRLEAIQIKIVKTATEPVEDEPVVYDKAGTNGPATGTQTIAGNVTVAADGVILQNLVIQGDLTISEAVGDGTVILNNVTVKGDTFVRGGGVNSIKINGGKYSRIVLEKTATGAVRIVATGVDGMVVVIAEAAAGETIILEGAFDSVTVNAPNMTVTTQGNTTTLGKMTVAAEAAGSTITLNAGTTVTDLVLDGKTATVKGQGTVTRAEVNADSAVFEKAPGSYAVESGVVILPVFPSTDSGGGGGYTPPAAVSVTGVSLDQTTQALIVGDSGKLTATVAPANAANQAVTWTSDKTAVATVDGAGNVKAVAAGIAVITVSTNDGSKTAACTVTVTTIPVTGVSLGASATVGLNRTTTLTATVAPANATNKNLTWSTSDADVATVDATGKVTGVKEGTANIFAATEDLNFISPACEVTVTYSFNVNIGTDGNGTITGMNGNALSIEIPAVIDGVPITAIGANAFNHIPLTSVTFATGSTLASIGANAFDETGLTGLTVPNTVTSIGPSAFANCKYLTTIGLPTGLASLSEKMFKNCESLTTITLPTSVKSIGANAFYNCQQLTGIVIPEEVTAIPEGTFDSCWALASVTLPSHLTTIDTNGFKTCKALKTLTLPASLAEIGQEAFSGAGTVDDTDSIISTLVLTFEGNAPTLLGTTGVHFATGTTFQYYAGCTGFKDTAPWKETPQYTLVELGVRTITRKDIKGVAIPFNGTLPVDVITADPQYTGTVSWTDTEDTTPISGNFDGTKAYTATITLKPANGYTATGVSFTVEGASATTSATINTDGTVTITAAFPVLEQFNIDAATGVITAYSGPGGNVTIPDQVGVTTVAGIGSYVFECNDTLTGITLPATVTTIGNGVFYNCINLSSMTFRGNEPQVGNVGAAKTDTIPSTTTIHFYSDNTGFDPANWSGYTMSPILAAPTVQDPSLVASTSATLNWTAVSGATGYQIYSGTSAANIITSVGSVSGTSYLLTGLTAEQSYYFTVTAIDSFGSSLPSIPITVTTLATI